MYHLINFNSRNCTRNKINFNPSVEPTYDALINFICTLLLNVMFVVGENFNIRRLQKLLPPEKGIDISSPRNIPRQHLTMTNR